MLGGMFREKALKKLSSPEQLDQLIIVTTPSGWIAYFAVTILLLTCVIWSLFGKIPVTIDGDGILIRGTGIHEINSPGDGVIVEMYAKENDIVKKNQIIAKISRPEIDWQIENTKNNIETLTKENQKENINLIQHLKFELEELKGELDLTSNIRSTIDGRIISIMELLDCSVKKGDNIAIIERYDEELGGLIFIPASLGGMVNPGMKVQVSLASTRNIYGFILGTVNSVTEYPITRGKMMSLLENEELVNTFMGKGAPLEVKITLDRDPGHPGGYKWYSGKGPSFQLHTGTLCKSKIIIRDFHPIDLIFQKF